MGAGRQLLEFQEMLSEHFDEKECSYNLCGQKFDIPEFMRAIDVFAALASNAVFEMGDEFLIAMAEEPANAKDAGFGIVLALKLGKESIGKFVLLAEDTRVVKLAQKRLENENRGLKWDCELSF